MYVNLICSRYHVRVISFSLAVILAEPWKLPLLYGAGSLLRTKGLGSCFCELSTLADVGLRRFPVRKSQWICQLI